MLKKLDSFGENVFKNDSKRVGQAITMCDTVCCYLEKVDLELVFGKKFDNIFHYNLKKWALMRSESLKLDHFAINYLITRFELKKAEDG